MIDLAVTQFLDVQISDTGDLPTVEGREALNQILALATLDAFYSDIGSLDKDGALFTLEEAARQTARDFPDYIQSVQSITATYTDEAKTSATVNITYLTGETFAFLIQ